MRQTTSQPVDPFDGLVLEPMATQADARAFKELNEAWITELFSLEPHDQVLLDDPWGAIVDRGGHVLIARDDDGIVGCVALVAAGPGVFELSKMTVRPDLRGLGLGRFILTAAVDFARHAGATSLFLGSNAALADAVHLYEDIGFTHVPADRIGPMPYTRADVFMRYDCA